MDRQFLLKPNHHPENPLLANTSPINAWDMSNDIIPEPSIINIIGAAVGRALEKYPGLNRDETTETLLVGGAKGYIQKPFTANELRRKLSEIVDG